jgi:sporulation protein YlmC with PRC-barrel domain
LSANIIDGQRPDPGEQATEEIPMRMKLATSAIALALAAPGFALAQQEQTPAPSATPGADIQVQQPAPEVTVQQPAPQITVQQPAPDVTIQQPEPTVTVQQPEPNVTVQQAEPNVEVQQQGEPNVQVQQAEQPDVTVRQPGTEQAEGAMQPGEQPATAAAATEPMWYSDMRGEEIIGQTLYGSNGEEIGEIDNVVMSQGGSTPEVLVGVGGFLGIGERDVAIPLNEIQMQGDRLTTAMTKDEIGGMEPYDESGYQEWDRTRPLGGAS